MGGRTFFTFVLTCVAAVTGFLLDGMGSATAAFNSLAQTRVEIEEDYSGDYQEEEEVGVDGSGSGVVQVEANPSMLDSLARIVRTLLGGRQTGQLDGNTTFGVDIQPNSFLDLVFNVIPGQVYENIKLTLTLLCR